MGDFVSDLVVTGLHCGQNLELSLTAEMEPTILLSKCKTLASLAKEPEIVQSEESSTGRIKEGKVKKLPLLSAMKLQPIRRWKHRTESSGLHNFGTCKTSCNMIHLF